jgi:Acetyltransferase (GNAT) domain
MTTCLANALIVGGQVVNNDVRVTLLDPSSPIWIEALGQVQHDVYHLPNYVSFAARQEGGDPVAIFAEFGGQWLLIPLVIRPISPELVPNGRQLADATSPYGYPSPLTNTPVDDENYCDELGLCLQASINALKERGIVSMFVRLHPLLPFSPLALDDLGTVVHHGDTVYIDLEQSEEELWNRTRATHRQDVVAARRRGCVAYIDEEWSRFDEFVNIYKQTMRRVQAEQYYFFPVEHFLDLKNALDQHVHLSVVEIDGEVACAGIVTEVDGIAQLYLSGTRREYLDLSPNKLRIDFLRTWAKSRGNRYLHLGGGVGGSIDSLFDFKLGFSHQRKAYYTWRVIVDDDVFPQVVSRWEDMHGSSADDAVGFFPPYRNSAL